MWAATKLSVRSPTPVRHISGLAMFDPLGPPFPQSQVIEGALQDAGMQKEQLDWLVLHQANMRILNSAADRLGVPQGGSVAWLSGGRV